jgi:hypothetical protein
MLMICPWIWTTIFELLVTGGVWQCFSLFTKRMRIRLLCNDLNKRQSGYKWTTCHILVHPISRQSHYHSHSTTQSQCILQKVDLGLKMGWTGGSLGVCRRKAIRFP